MTETINWNVWEHQHRRPLFKQTFDGDQYLLKSDHDSGCKHLTGALGGDPVMILAQIGQIPEVLRTDCRAKHHSYSIAAPSAHN
jgi:hypothetical protein